MQSVDSIEKYAYGTRKDLVSKKEENKCQLLINKRESIDLNHFNDPKVFI